MQAVPYFRLSGFYFFYFASIGILVPFWSLYLNHLGYDKVEIGQLVSILMAPKIFAPYLWGWLADHSQRRIQVIRFATLGSALVFSLTLWVTSFPELAAISALFGFFWHAALPQFEVVTLDHLGEDKHHYSRIRVWGSVGFILVVMVLPWLFDRTSIDYLPLLSLIILGMIFVMTIGMRDFAHAQDRGDDSILRVIAKPAVIALMLASFLQLVSHGPYYTFFTIYMREHGYSLELAGQLWALGVFAEVALFLAMHRLLMRFKASWLLQLSILITLVRWIITATLADWLPALLFAQLMHAASYGLFHAAAIHMVHQMFPGILHGRGQALYASFSFGLGGSLGALMSGYTWVTLGDKGSFLIAAMVAALGYVIAVIGLRQARGLH
jgi:PPP family 3-phenylpropionic acid transporter